ncbi:MAG TPA: chromosomal replication initiator protein DnaA [Phycisphaerae bacterium]|nr:chromosomal replication initiator protein DnaA [Phycisphaerae bacterium]
MFVPRADVLSSISARIAEKLGPQKYKVWFRNATQFTVVGNHLKISTPNTFLCGWIERNFAEVIGEAVREVTGQEHQLSFVVDPRLLVALKKRQLNSQADFIAKNPERLARQNIRGLREGSTPSASPSARKLRGRFADLVIGPANELAASVIRRLADPAAESYSPVFVHGGCGLGKTHLVQALANEFVEKHPTCRWRYTTGDEFTNEFVLAIRSNRVEAFRQRYRHLDVLIIDDIHFLTNKKATQEEFLHTFNAIDGHRRKIVLTSDTHPKLIGQFSEQLINRFMAGMVVRLEVPDFAMRCEILRRRAAGIASQSIPEDVIAYMAGHLTSNVRELEGALLKLLMFGTVAHQPLTLSLARRALADHIERSKRSLGLEEIDQTVATYFGLTPADLHTSRKARTIALARGIAMYLARKHTEMSFPEIGRFMGNKNHSTVILASRRMAALLEADELVQRQTPAGMAQERLREIVGKIEEQLGLSCQAGRSASPTVEPAQNLRCAPPEAVPGITCPLTKPGTSRMAAG